MKKRILTLILIVIALSATAQEWHSISNNKPTGPTVQLISSTDDEITVCFHLDGFFTLDVATQRGPACVVSVPEMVSQLEAGSPDLPMTAIPLIIDDIADMEVSVAKASFTDFEGISIAPSKGNLSRQVNPDEVPYTFGTMYGSDDFYPVKAALMDAPYILRDFRGQNILVRPFAYNPATHTLRVFHDMTLVVRPTDQQGTNVKAPRKSNQLKVDAELHQHYQRHFLNFDQGTAKYNFIEDRGTMLVISADPYAEAMQPLVDWKNLSGRPCSMVTLSEIGGNNSATIKAYIQQRYLTDNLEFVLLVGDHDELSPKQISGGSSDAWFGQLEGNDHYIEVFVGRFSVESIADVETQVNKVIYYERDMPSHLEWVDKGVGIGSTDGPGHNGGETDMQHIEYIRDTLLHYTYTEVSQRYNYYNNPTAAQLTTDFNAGASICNYCNHGSETSWFVCGYNNAHVNALTNDYRWPCIISTACLNGKFNYSQPCFAETWMRATNPATGAPTGAIGGMFSWPNQSWDPPMTGQDEMNAILCEWRSTDLYCHTMAGALLNGNMRILDLHPTDAGITHDTWILFGDPSLMLRTTNPTALNVDFSPEVFMPGLSQMSLTADADFGIATLSIDGHAIASSYLHDGMATLSFEPLTGIGTATLVVTAYNKETFVQEIDIVALEGPYVVFEDFSVTDANHQLDFDETAPVNLRVKNVGIATASNVSVTLSSSSDYVNQITGSATIASLAPGDSYDIENAFTITTADDVPDGTKATFTLCCTDGTSTWSSTFNALIYAPQLILIEAFTPTDVEPGSDGILRLQIKNAGRSTSSSGLLMPTTGSPFVSFTNPTTPMPPIEPGITTDVDIAFHITSSAPNGSAHQVRLLAEAGHYGFEQLAYINVGSIREDFETGDFSKFNWMFSGGNWTIVSDVVHSGNYAARSAAITNNHSTDMIMTTNVVADGQISFWVRTSSETLCDKLHFYIDNTDMGVWSGISEEWEKATFEISEGFHLLRWVYAKDASSTMGDDCVWIDDIQFPVGEVWNVDDCSLQFAVYPNPASTTLHIEADTRFNYTIINLMGQQVATGIGHGDTNISLATLPRGLYLVRISNVCQTAVVKLIVE